MSNPLLARLGAQSCAEHGTCNGEKYDRIASEEHLPDWAEHSERNAAALGQQFDSFGITSNLDATVKIVGWAYSQTCLKGDLTWVRGDEMRPLPPDWSKPLVNLLN